MIGEPKAMNHPDIMPRLSCHEWLTAQSARLQKKQRAIPANVPHHIISARSGQGIRSSNPIMTFSVYSKPPGHRVCQFSVALNPPFDGYNFSPVLRSDRQDHRLRCHSRRRHQRHRSAYWHDAGRDGKADRLCSRWNHNRCRQRNTRIRARKHHHHTTRRCHPRNIDAASNRFATLHG